MVLRRTILLGAIAALLPRFAAAKNDPKVIVLGPGITSPVFKYGQSAPKVERSLRGWLVCNGAQADRTIYAELFEAIGEQFGPGDEVRTFNLPSLPLEMKSDDPLRGMAICPSAQLGTAAEFMPFDVNSNT
jgi:hypothetical protein